MQQGPPTASRCCLCRSVAQTLAHRPQLAEERLQINKQIIKIEKKAAHTPQLLWTVNHKAQTLCSFHSPTIVQSIIQEV